MFYYDKFSKIMFYKLTVTAARDKLML